jgi:hypothetical protein
MCDNKLILETDFMSLMNEAVTKGKTWVENESTLYYVTTIVLRLWPRTLFIGYMHHHKKVLSIRYKLWRTETYKFHLAVGGRRALVEREIVKIPFSCVFLPPFPFPPLVKGSKLDLRQRHSHLDDALTSKSETIDRQTLLDRSADCVQPNHSSPE